ncbi:MAG TPA: restriction endonuclease subunit S [Phycisphaerales bacterium]|nr:restriction endonuclease subunit S [Phycisphaerales bacterium]
MSDPDRMPRSWTVAPLSRLCEKLVDGSHLPPAKQATGRPMLSAKNIGNGTISLDGRFITPEAFAAEDARTRVRPGDVLLTIVGTIGRAAVVPESLETVTLQRSVAVLKPLALQPRFCMYQLQSPDIQRKLEQDARGTAQKGVYLKTLGRIELRVAPRPEQDRIVAKIEELFSDLDAGVAALERVRANLKRYRAAVLKAAVEGRLTEEWRTRHPATEPAAKLLERILAERRAKWEQDQLRKFKESGKTPPKGWKESFEDSSAALTDGLGSLPPGWSWSNIDRIADVQGGIQKQPKRAPVKNAFPYLRVANVRRDQLLLDDMEKFELFPGELERLRLEPNDLLIVEGNGSLTEIGRSAIWRGEIPNCVHQNHIIRVRPLGVLTGFVNMYWNSPNGAKRVMAEAASTSGLYTLSVTKVCRLPVPIPPLAEQAEIVAEVDRRLSVADAAETQVEHALQRAARLRQAILKRAFEGKLVEQDPTDEPAAALLERIKPATNGKPPAPAKPPMRRSRARV